MIKSYYISQSNKKQNRKKKKEKRKIEGIEGPRRSSYCIGPGSTGEVIFTIAEGPSTSNVEAINTNESKFKREDSNHTIL